MSGQLGLQEDPKGKLVQGFAPIRLVEVTADVAWTPEFYDIAFCTTADVNYIISTGTTEAPLAQGSVRVIRPGVTYTFDTTTVIEVM